MSERNRNIWAPWRMEYIESLHKIDEEGCFLCRHWADPGLDAECHVVWRGSSTVTMFNRYPYTNGHLLVAPGAHTADMTAMSHDVLAELMEMVRDGQRLLSEAVKAQGFNVGMNLGRCAGAGVPEHLHIHVVPRWNGDTNFMSVLGDTRVVPQSSDALYAIMTEVAGRLGLPPLVGAAAK